MIVDRLDTAFALYHLPARLARALEFLRTSDTSALAVGRHDLDGDRLFALVQDYMTRLPHDCVWEAHRRYIDVQYIATGVERMGIAALSTMVEKTPYDLDRDVAFFEPGRDFLTLDAGTFAIFAPVDVHSPGHQVAGAHAVRKIVVKAAVDGL